MLCSLGGLSLFRELCFDLDEGGVGLEMACGDRDDPVFDFSALFQRELVAVKHKE